MQMLFKTLFSLFPVIFIQCHSQKSPSSGSFVFNEITFHSSRCNGSCPDISLKINSDRSVELTRTIYFSKSLTDTLRSGAFKGVLDQKNYIELITLLKAIDWENTIFPKVDCCDKPIIQILLTFNDSMHKYKSMNPPESTIKLIDFLTNLATTINLPSYDKAMDFEVIMN